MCGIAGIIARSVHQAPANRAHLMHLLQQMTDALAHRGPDGDGHWMNSDGTVLLGHRRLAIIDLTDAAVQPMHYLNRYSIVHNGEIYNYKELRNTLEQKGYHFQSASDTEVILAAYHLWGTYCLQHFDGMFAFAIWDRETATLFAARDRFGEKPFYYAFTPDAILFASEMKALWTIGFPKIIDERMLLNYLALGYTQNANNKKQTFYRDIFALPPGHYLLHEQGKKIPQTQVNPYFSINKEYQRKWKKEDALEQLTALLKQSVSRRLRSDVAVGTSLSGGLDSAGIAALMQLVEPNAPSTAFSAVFPGFNQDETPWQELVSHHLQLERIVVEPQVDQLIHDLPIIAYHQEEPMSSSSVFAQYHVYKQAQESGVSVLLDGQGADEIFGGYPRYIHWYLQQLVSRRKFSSLRRELEAFTRHNVPIKWGPANWLAAFFPAQTAIRLERREYNRIMHQPDFREDFRLFVKGKEWAGIHKPVITKINDILHFNTMTFGLEELLRYADRNSMAHGREVRLPYLQHELVSFVFSLPTDFKFQDGYTKRILRETLTPYLPDKLVWRTDKIGFEPPQKTWMEHPKMQEYIRAAKLVLVEENVLHSRVLDQPVHPQAAHEADNFDWRYLSAALMIRGSF
jgi:asparagine synthase (glutamine-hydrolysing)